MGTTLLSILFTGQIDWGLDNDRLSIIGQIYLLVAKCTTIVLIFIVAFPLALVENLFIVPAWLLYNLSHKKGFRKTYLNFLGLKEENKSEVKHD